jgi:hypothetical protein
LRYCTSMRRSFARLGRRSVSRTSAPVERRRRACIGMPGLVHTDETSEHWACLSRTSRRGKRHHLLFSAWAQGVNTWLLHVVVFDVDECRAQSISLVFAFVLNSGRAPADWIVQYIRTLLNVQYSTRRLIFSSERWCTNMRVGVSGNALLLLLLAPLAAHFVMKALGRTYPRAVNDDSHEEPCVRTLSCINPTRPRP